MPDSKISALTNYTPPISTDELAIVDVTTTETKKITVSNLIYTWISDVDAGGNNLINIGYGTFDRIADPGNPGTDEGRLYVKQVDGNNDGLFMRIKQAGSFQEVQII